MLKVALLFYEPTHSGQGTHVLSLARGLARSKYDLLVIPPAANHYTVQALREAAVRVCPLPMGKWGGLRAVTQLIALLRRERVRLLHVHSQEAGIFGRLAGRLAGVPVVIYTPQTIDIRQKRWQRLYWRLEWLLAGLTNAVIAVNQADCQRLIAMGIPARKVHKIPNGIDPLLFQPDLTDGGIRQSLGIGPADPVVLQIGRLSTQKDPFTLLQAAVRVVHERPGAHFLLVGEGPLRDKVTGAVEALGLQGCVHLLGWRSDVPELLLTSDVVAQSSRWEGAPYALLEAMAVERPVVATAVNGSGEIIADGETGYLVPPGDAASMANKILDLLQHPEQAARMGQAGRKRVEALFPLDRMISQVESLYDRLAEKCTAG